MKGMELVFHTASLIPTCIRHTPKAMDEVNMGGTINIVNACKQCDVKRLLYTSSCAVMFGNDRSVKYEDVDEFVPFPEFPLNDYVRTKGKAELLVRQAYNETGLRTCALRLTGLIAEKKDPIMRALINFLVGPGDFLMSWTTLQAAAEVHILSAEHLKKNSLSPSTNIFNVVSKNVTYKDMNEFFCIGYNGKSSGSVPIWLCKMMAIINEFFFGLTGWPPLGDDLGLMVMEFITPYTLSTKYTEQELGWAEKRPWKVVMDETIHREY